MGKSLCLSAFSHSLFKFIEDEKVFYMGKLLIHPQCLKLKVLRREVMWNTIAGDPRNPLLDRVDNTNFDRLVNFQYKAVSHAL